MGASDCAKLLDQVVIALTMALKRRVPSTASRIRCGAASSAARDGAAVDASSYLPRENS
jgi:hypothetical protein